MNEGITSEQLHRSVKLALDSGEAATLAEAQRLFQGYRLQIDAGPEIAVSSTLQAALLTAVNTGRRCFLGGVQIAGALDVPLRVPWRRCRTLAEAVMDLQGRIVPIIAPALPRIVFGEPTRTAIDTPFAVSATFDGWAGGVVPLEGGSRLAERQDCPPAGVLAGALAVSEAFQYVRGSNIEAGRRAVGLSLWSPNAALFWQDAAAVGPPLEVLPSQLWLIGLGHLGQAYLWTLGFLPYTCPEDVRLVLQDVDRLAQANDSTSPLTNAALLGMKKTRAMANWCEERGFQTKLVERRFAANMRVDNDEPPIALCGVDNALARAALEDVGFRRVVEAGLGKGLHEYLAFQVHTFPARRLARERWSETEQTEGGIAAPMQPAYQALADAGLDQCGLTVLAGRSVGASFVGTAVATLVVAELLRMVLGEERHELIDGTLRTPLRRQTIVATAAREPFNPGYTLAMR